MKENIDILHVYAGTRGASGLYLDEIYKALNSKYSQEVVVSYFYPFTYGKKWFYRNSDISSIGFVFLNINIVRKALRFFELLITLIKILFFVKFKKVEFVNYGLTSDLTIELFFIKILKLISTSKVIITCHDVLPFGSEDPNVLLKKIKKKKQFFDLADYLLIHNENSKEDLMKYYNICQNKVFMISFPLMDLNNLDLKVQKTKILRDEKKFTIGMFGNLRQEKGVDVLLKAWDDMYQPSINIQLIIAGYVPDNIEYGFEDFTDKSVLIYDRFINDSEFKSLIEVCDVVVLPYKRGTNSGIPSQILSADTLVLTSDIPMFRNNMLISREFLFKSEDFNDLSSKLKWLSSLDESSINHYKKTNAELLVRYNKIFSENILEEFNKIFFK